MLLGSSGAPRVIAACYRKMKFFAARTRFDGVSDTTPLCRTLQVRAGGRHGSTVMPGARSMRIMRIAVSRPR